MKKKLSRLLKTAIFLILLGIILIKPATQFLSTYLSKSERVNANILLVEGWIPDYALEIAYNEFQKSGYNYIVTTGLNYPKSFYRLAKNGYLIFYPKKGFPEISDDGPHTIELVAFSECVSDICAHFNLFINDSIVADFYTTKKTKNYKVRWNGRISKIDSLMVQFDNDKVYQNTDMSLCVREIIFDHKIHISYQFNSDYDIGELDGKHRIKNDFTYYSELARRKLIAMGLDSSSVISISGKKISVNRTLTTALQFRDWLKTTTIKVEGINIITLGIHARRTWMIYDKTLDKKFRIGIISVPDYSINNSPIHKLMKTIRETLGIIYYWFILIPY